MDAAHMNSGRMITTYYSCQEPLRNLQFIKMDLLLGTLVGSGTFLRQIVLLFLYIHTFTNPMNDCMNYFRSEDVLEYGLYHAVVVASDTLSSTNAIVDFQMFLYPHAGFCSVDCDDENQEDNLADHIFGAETGISLLQSDTCKGFYWSNAKITDCCSGYYGDCKLCGGSLSNKEKSLDGLRYCKVKDIRSDLQPANCDPEVWTLADMYTLADLHHSDRLTSDW